MNKEEERLQLHKVFGAQIAENAQDFESPDFLIATPNQGTLGVEITSIYISNADAKLRNLPYYMGDLIDKNRQVHRADQGEFEVGEIELQDKDGVSKGKATAVIQKMPTTRQRIDLLLAKVAEKESKVSRYLQHCYAVDLIVVDQANLFYHENYEGFYDFFHSLIHSPNLLQNPFREIYLLTTSKDKKSVYLPLIANAFITDCFAYEHLISSATDAGRSEGEFFKLLAACLDEHGYRNIKMRSEETSIGFQSGAWELHYSEDGMNIRDWMVPHENYGGKLLPEIVFDLSSEQLEKARIAVQKRSSLLSTVEVRLPIYEV